MPADVGRERPVAFRQRRDHGVPARSGVGEAVEEDDIARHQIRIMTVTDTYLLLRAFCDELARSGMEHACTAPGSRCTPIVLSLAREPRIHTWSHIDERCAGFFALGAAKRSGRPVAVTCTSGTAAANLAPAVIEARHARVPLIVLTADRPAELRDVGAGQTIDQLKLYGDAVKWFFEVGVDEATPGDACGGSGRSRAGPTGPRRRGRPGRSTSTSRCASRSCSIAEPRCPRTTPAARRGPPVRRVRRRPAERAVRRDAPGRADRDRRRRRPRPRAAGDGGALRRADGHPAARRPAVRRATRRRPRSRTTTCCCATRQFAAAHQPQFVIRTGDLPTSKPLRAWLAGLETAQIAIDPDGTWHDPDAVVGMRIRAPLPGPPRRPSFDRPRVARLVADGR